MLVAYIDESGDTGNNPVRSSKTFTLGCVLVEAESWNNSFSALIDLRRRLKMTYSIPVRAELKANYLIRNTGTLNSTRLSPSQRHLIYRAHLRQLAKDQHAKAFAIVVHKSMNYFGKDVFDNAWTALLQRLERTSHNRGGVPVLIIHDEGENPAIRKLARWSRRRLSAGSFRGSGSLLVPFTQLIDDPIPKASRESYFLQMADLVAYAAFRRIYPPSRSIAEVVNQNMWENLGQGVLVPANQNRVVTVPGIVEIWK